MTTRTAFLAFLALWAAAAALGQPVVTPTPDRPSDFESAGGYTVSNSFETGYRFAAIGGNEDVYRANVNYGNGLRLFEGELRIDSEDGRGRLVDEFSFNTRGAPTDPYQSSVVRAAKHGVYRYDMRLRATDYHNQLPALWSGERGLRTERTWQSHDLTLFPGKAVEILLGYGRNKRSGPGFSSAGIPDAVGAFQSDNFLRFETDLRQVNNQYRGGVNVRAFGLALTAMQSFDNYKEDTHYRDASALPLALDNVQAVTALRRDEPIHGNTPVTQIALRSEKDRRIGFHGRFAYASGERNSTLSADTTAFDPEQQISTLRQTFVFGQASRKQGTGDFTVTLLPSARWTVTNTTAVNNTRIEGGADFLEVSQFANQFLRFESLGIRHITNATEANFRPVKRLSLYGAYRFSTRRTSTRDAIEFPEFGFENELVEIDNNVHAGAAGLRWLPAKGLRVSVDLETGRADQPLTPVSEKEFHNERLRVQWRKNGFAAAAYFKNEINTNPAELVDYSSDGRSGGFQVSWADPDARWTFDGGYAWIHLDTSAGIFNLFEPGQAARTFYTSNLHTANFGARLALHDRATLYLGYSLAKDTGDGADRLSAAEGVEANYPNFGFDGANFFVAFPLTYQTPQGRLSIVVSEKLSWNFGWQYYSYGERFTGVQGYRAHVGYSSFRWSF